MTYEEAAQAKAEIDEAVKVYRTDPRFRAMAQSTASLIMDEAPQRQDYSSRDLHDVALDSAILMLARVYWRDAEIARLRHERDAYKKAAEQRVMFEPMPHVVTL